MEIIKMKLLQLNKEELFKFKPEKTSKIYFYHGKFYTKNPINKFKRKSKKETKEVYQELWFHWELKRGTKVTREEYLGEASYTPLGYCRQINAFVTNENVVEMLNSKVEIDFDYRPQEHDMLVINPVYKNQNALPANSPFPIYRGIGIAFIYQVDQWVVNKGFDQLDYDYEFFSCGVAEIEF